jgi:anti-sigma-K factor RskA
MTDLTGCLHVRHTLGVYVLGAIDPAERAAVDAHLAGCSECREELAGLAGLPALLGRVPFGEAERISGSYSERTMPAEQADEVTLAPVLAKVARQRRVRRWRGLAAAAAVVLAASTAATVSMHAADAPAAVHWHSDQMTDSATHIRLAVRYAPQPGGTKLEAQVTGIPKGTTCEFWVTGPGDERWPAGSWTVADTWQGVWYQGSSSVPFEWVRGFEITSGKTVLAMLKSD